MASAPTPDELAAARATLGVDESATWSQTRLKYKKAALKTHPDRNPGDATAAAAFVRLRAAYELLERHNESLERREREDAAAAEATETRAFFEERMRERAHAVSEVQRAEDAAREAMFEQGRARARANAVPPRPTIIARDESSLTVSFEPPDAHLFGSTQVYELQYCLVRCADGPASGHAYVWRVASDALEQTQARKKNLLPAPHAYAMRVRARNERGEWSQLSEPSQPIEPAAEPLGGAAAAPSALLQPPPPPRLALGQGAGELLISRPQPPPGADGRWEAQFRAARGLWTAVVPPTAEGGAPPSPAPLASEVHALGGLSERASYTVRARLLLPQPGGTAPVVWGQWSDEAGPIAVRAPTGARPASSGVRRSVGKALLHVGLRSSAKDADVQCGAKLFADGSAYQGELRQGLAHGTGELRLARGGACAGSFELDVPHGACRMEEADAVYTGAWRCGLRHGEGEQRWAAGPYELYAGGWADGLFDGKGRLTMRSGETYVGGWQRGLRHGHGEARSGAEGSGDYYVGEWRAGAYGGKGKGRFTFADKSVYEGTLLDGVRHGEGTLAVPPDPLSRVGGGFRYSGGFAAGEPHGKGTLELGDGRTYAGEFAKGRRHGKGKMSWPSGDFVEGVWEQGQQAGDARVRLSYPNGDVYTGGVRQGSQHGEGEYARAGGSVYKGQWALGQRHGKGVWRAPSGDFYDGGWEKDERRGKARGRLSFPSGVYTGDLTDGQLTGKGTFVWADGRKYEGEWNSGSPHGSGKFWDVDGDHYVGHFHRSQFHGKGKLTLADGDWYHGEFSMGERAGTGKARITYASGDVYEGEVVSNVKSGKGKYVWRATGDVYTGEWASDRMHGKGTLKGPGGTRSGTWRDGDFVAA